MPNDNVAVLIAACYITSMYPLVLFIAFEYFGRTHTPLNVMHPQNITVFLIRLHAAVQSG